MAGPARKAPHAQSLIAGPPQKKARREAGPGRLFNSAILSLRLWWEVLEHLRYSTIELLFILLVLGG
jgi:hypothetical protein